MVRSSRLCVARATYIRERRPGKPAGGLLGKHAAGDRANCKSASGQLALVLRGLQLEIRCLCPALPQHPHRIRKLGSLDHDVVADLICTPCPRRRHGSSGVWIGASPAHDLTSPLVDPDPSKSDLISLACSIAISGTGGVEV